MQNSQNKSPLPVSRRETREITNQSNGILHRIPAFGKQLIARQRFRNPPELVVICVGVAAWKHAKIWKADPNYAALVLTAGQDPELMQWPVEGCDSLIHWSTGPGEQLIITLIECLLRSGATAVTVFPAWVDFNKPSVLFDDTNQRWIPAREKIRTYAPRKGISNAA